MLFSIQIRGIFKLKDKLYESIVLSTALYSCHNWKTSAKVIYILDMLHLRYILKIRKEEMLRRANPSVIVAHMWIKFNCLFPATSLSMHSQNCF